MFFDANINLKDNMYGAINLGCEFKKQDKTSKYGIFQICAVKNISSER